MEGKQYYRTLLQKYMAGNASEEEINDLFEELSRNEDSKEWEGLIAEITMAAANDPAYDKERWEPLVSRILGEKEKPPVRSLNSVRRWWWAAASVIILLGAGAYFLFFSPMPVSQQPASEIMAVHDVKAPQTSRATITLANGQKILLDSAASGTLATQNNISIVKTADGKIAYSEASKAPSEGGGLGEATNTLTNPRGSKVIDMTLSDGSRVWLNAGSSITYPVAFAGKERKVSITGEAYFEVSHLPLSEGGRSFIVSGGSPFGGQGAGWTVTVLGTHFNVNAYDDEDAARVTLLEGSVRVSSPLGKGREGVVILKPGDQGVIRPSALSLQHNVDLTQIMAWKNGKFDFGEGTDIRDIMRQVSRWYDVDIVYHKEVNDSFWGSVSRQANISKVLEKFELTGRIHFKVEDRKVMVDP